MDSWGGSGRWATPSEETFGSGPDDETVLETSYKFAISKNFSLLPDSGTVIINKDSSAKVRYRQPDQPMQVEEIDGERMNVSFERPQRAVTPGQSIVLYDGDVCLGGGIIETMNTPPMGTVRQ